MPLTVHDHSRKNLKDFSYVYAVYSRRAKGVSIGINLNPDKACNFDCVYCQVDRSSGGDERLSLPRLEKEMHSIFSQLADGTLLDRPPFCTLPEDKRHVQDVSFSGDGEPTASPAFPAAVQLVEALKQAHGLNHLKVTLITNATLLHRPAVQGALRTLHETRGEIWAKLDAGNEQEYRVVNRSAVPFERIVSNITGIARQWPIVIQTMVFETDSRACHPMLDDYVQRIGDILASGGRIGLIQLYSVARPPAHVDIRAVSESTLTSFAGEVAQRTGVRVETYPGSPAFLRAGESR